MIRVLLGLLGLLVAAVVLLAALEAGSYDVAALGRSAPRRTALMRERIRQAARAGRSYHVRQTWVRYADISPLLRRAVLIAEDDAFFQHGGLDWDEMAASARRDLAVGRFARGGSTITQQLAKNVYLGDRRTLSRKLAEVFLALRIERALSKRRIFELYLNLIEWGDGLYGVEAAARHDFGVPAAALSPRQAVLLAAVIINPRRYPVLDPPRRIERRVRLIAGRMWRRGLLSEVQYREAIGELDPAAAAPPDSATPAPVLADSAATAPDREPAR
jgi:monofunctional biosynthetic peptidoglycan transglycosylase